MIDNTTDPRLSLQTRIRYIEKQIAELEGRRAKLQKLLTTYRTILSQEAELQDEIELDETTVPAFHPTNSNSTLADFLVHVLGTGPKTLDKLKDLGSNLPHLINSNSPGRAINFALVGLQKGGHVERLKDGTWKLVSAKAESVTETPR